MGPRRKQPPKQSTYWYDISFGLLLGSFGGFLFVAGIYMITLFGYTRIDTVLVEGAEVVSTDRITQSVSETLGQYCLIHASCQYGLWVPTDFIVSNLLVAFPRIKSADVVYDRATSSLKVQIRERRVAFRYCGDELFQYCYFADNQSNLFEKAPLMSDLRSIPTVVPDLEKIAVHIAGSVLPVRLWNDTELAQYNELLNILAPHARIYIARYTRRDINTEVDKLYNYSLVSNTAVLKFNRKSLSDREQIPYIAASIERLQSFQPFIGRFSVYPQSLQYLDFRFPKRMYMKFDQGIAESVVEPEKEKKV